MLGVDSKVRIFDTTLRDGEQTPGVSITPEQKVQIAINRVSRLGFQTLAPIVRNGPINHRTAIDALPRVENQEEIREPFQIHQPFALRTFHFCPLCDES